MKSNKLSIILILLVLAISSCSMMISGKISFEYEKTPPNSGFKMEGYWIWCGSVIKVDSVYHLFASRWPKSGPFPEGYRTNSEIVRATSTSAVGPYKFEEVVIGQRDSTFWDSNMAHNPTIHKIGDDFVLFYIGSDFTTCQSQSKSLLRRVGYACSKSVSGPWIRSEKPLINQESNNPAVLVENGNLKLMFRDSKLRVFIAEARNYAGPYKISNENVWHSSPLEDFYLFKANHEYHLLCEDNVGAVSGHVRWGAHLCSNNGLTDWKKGEPLIVYNHEIELSDGNVIHCKRRERPQLIIGNNRITCLITSVYDGNNSWSQPVKLKYPIPLD